MHKPSPPGGAEALSRRAFVSNSAAWTMTSLAAAQAIQADMLSDAATEQTTALPACPHPLLTPAESFNTVARGNPKPHTLTGKALVEARMTPETWRLEITADSRVEPPHVTQPARMQAPRTLKDGTALDLETLRELGKSHGIKFIKATQCLNIPEPLGQGLWEGVPLREVLKLCGKMRDVRRIYYRGFHNKDPEQIFQSSLSYTQAMETPPVGFPPMLAYRLNGQPITPLRGGPVRMIVPWAHGFKSIKWLQQIFLTNDYRANDTYALQNNDPESHLKTSAYIDPIPELMPAGQPVVLTGKVISGLSDLERVEYSLRQIIEDAEPRQEAGQEHTETVWRPCPIFPPPDWEQILPQDVKPHQLLGFDAKTGQPKAWPLRFGMGYWGITLHGLQAGVYEVRVRAVDGNGFAQPEPRPLSKSGGNAVEMQRFQLS